MANQIPLSGATDAAGGFLLPTEQGEILVNGVLQEAGAIALAGDSRATGSRKTQFPIWLGTPTAGAVGEGAKKPTTGAEFGQTTLNVKKFASTVLFTDEMLEDVQGGDLNVLVDSGVRAAISDVIDAHATGYDSGTAIAGVFDQELDGTTTTVDIAATGGDRLEKAISAGLGVLEGNGYGNPADQGVLLGFGWEKVLRDASEGGEATARLYTAGRDPFYGRQRQTSTNLKNADAVPGVSVTFVYGFVVHKPNLHVRLRRDVTVSTSTEATVSDGTTDRNLFEENLTAIRYETRLAFGVHDLNRAVVKLKITG